MITLDLDDKSPWTHLPAFAVLWRGKKGKFLLEVVIELIESQLGVASFEYAQLDEVGVRMLRSRICIALG